jgi:hypothetical protein
MFPAIRPAAQRQNAASGVWFRLNVQK